uniref:Small vasohibin-binding protein n=1 Tax=Trichobilharzia regenti TaxID=157069 RepID=A0AA85JEE5_TRIRE|nr:unnamed protein product [Trichobilharzia regenti]
MSRVNMIEKSPKEISVTSAKKKKNGLQKNVSHRNNIHDIRNTHLTPIRKTPVKGDFRKPPKDSFSSRLTDHHKSKLKLPKAVLSNMPHKSEFLNNDEERELFAKQRSIIYQLNEIMKRSEIANYEAFINSEHTTDH